MLFVVFACAAFSAHPAQAQRIEPMIIGDNAGDAATSLDKATTLPAAPTGLQALAVTSRIIVLVWDDKATNEDDYRIEYRTPSTTFQELTDTAPANTSAIFISNLTPGTTYIFRVRAHNNIGFSAYSNEVTVTTPASDGPCVQTTTAMCLNNDRFRVQALFLTPQGQSGEAHAVKLTDDSGYLWFFSATNIEAVVKVLNGCVVDNNYWFFAGGLTNVRVLTVVVDTSRGSVRAYLNRQGRAFQPIQDTTAFPTCP
jgi:hypothetical protein